MAAGQPASADENRDPLDRVVRVAADVPCRAERLRSARRVRGATHQHPVTGTGVPGRGPRAPRERIARRVADLRIPPARAVVADLDARDRSETRPRPATELACPASTMRERLRNSGMPGGTMSARGTI